MRLRTGLSAGLFLLLSALACFLAAGCADRPGPPRPGEFVAFSLQEAERLARRGGPQSEALRYLGGMPRLVGGVSDPGTGEVILVGQVVEGLPRARLDDFVAALQARLLHGVWPRVSIDPIAETPRTGLQAVRLSEGLIDVPFGSKLLACDVILKRYSLELLKGLPAVPSYRALCERDIARRAKEHGTSIERARWVQGDRAGGPVKPYQGRRIAGEAGLMVRYWCYPLDTYSVAQAEGAFVIRELQIGVSRELSSLQGSTEVGHQAAEEFSLLMSQHLRQVSQRYPVLLWAPSTP
ncbi:MAG: hypothetical protein HYY20_05615 [Candidatus Tectomicrobia bacterium]|uniref:Lipoprotein n=1 Tax=Tectimicrobiota bacterium TaxID=2528274 RepID=A0A932CMX6_UNCTE|nr:hypothetical protein [Candidatus Tectomicrobia bacterium]